MFVFERNVHVYETDLMGIVHHSNYLRLCEEARVDWCRKNNALGTEKEDIFGLTVLETRVRHLWPARYGDLLKIEVQARVSGVRLFFQYRISAGGRELALAETSHCGLDLDFKVKRLDKALIETVEKSAWTGTWL